MTEIPNREWYSKLSQERGAPFRCPFATVEACPRYYQSLSLLGAAGSTKIPEAEDERLLKHWKSSDLWPRTDEQATGIFGEPGNPFSYYNFCPEVTFERFGFFATSLSRYADELDAGHAHGRLAKEGVLPGHPNWSWSSCIPQHFTDCSIYAVLAHRDTAPQPQKPGPWWRKHLAEIVVAVVVALATAIITKVFA
jgi:hypothetical protein